MVSKKVKKGSSGGSTTLKRYGREHFVALAKRRAEIQREAMELWKKKQKKK